MGVRVSGALCHFVLSSSLITASSDKKEKHHKRRKKERSKEQLKDEGGNSVLPSGGELSSNVVHVVNEASDFRRDERDCWASRSDRYSELRPGTALFSTPGICYS